MRKSTPLPRVKPQLVLARSLSLASPVVSLLFHSCRWPWCQVSVSRCLSQFCLHFVSSLYLSWPWPGPTPRSLALFCLLTLAFISLFLSPALVVLVSLLSSPFTLVHLLAFFICIFFLVFAQQLCSSLPPLSLSLSLRLFLTLYLSPLSSPESFRAKLCLSVSLDFPPLLSESVPTFLSGCVILRKASKGVETIESGLFKILPWKKREGKKRKERLSRFKF